MPQPTAGREGFAQRPAGSSGDRTGGGDMKNASGMVGCGLFLLLTLRQAATYGREWQVGKFRMPASMLHRTGAITATDRK